MAFNILVFLHVSSNNLNTQVHRHTPPKALCLFDITHVTHQLGSVHQFDKYPSGLIFFLLLAQVSHFYVLVLADLGPLSTLLKFDSLSTLVCCRPFLDFGSSSASFEVWFIVNPGPLSTPFGVLACCLPF